MSQLKNENLDKCFSLLREYLDEGPLSNKKRNAVLALNQLQKITAGTDFQGNSPEASGIICTGRPRFDGSPTE